MKLGGCVGVGGLVSYTKLNRWVESVGFLNRCTYYCHHKQQTCSSPRTCGSGSWGKKTSCVGSGRNREGRHHWLFGVLSSSKGTMTLLHITIACYCAAFRTPVSCYSLDQTATQPIDSTWEFDCQHISQSVQVLCMTSEVPDSWFCCCVTSCDIRVFLSIKQSKSPVERCFQAVAMDWGAGIVVEANTAPRQCASYPHESCVLCGLCACLACYTI
jgi:hypothetical protein